MQFHGKKRLSPIKCPLCGQINDIIVNGLINNFDGTFGINEEAGYAFCNCHNIFYVDWANIEIDIYSNPNYTQDYAKKPSHRKRYAQYAKTYFPMIQKEMGKNARFLEIGCSMDPLLDEAAKIGWKTTGLDIVKKKIKKKHKFITANFEEIDLKEKFDIIWSSHTFEHFRETIKALKKIWNILNSNGWIFISMPDPIFINWGDNPYLWAHWVMKEHHILWDMDSFVDVMKQEGFKIIKAKHNLEEEYWGHTDFHILARKNG